MVLEQLGIPDVTAQGIDRPMPVHVHQLEQRRAEVRKPERRLWPANIAGSSPARSAASLTTTAKASVDSRARVPRHDRQAAVRPSRRRFEAPLVARRVRIVSAGYWPCIITWRVISTRGGGPDRSHRPQQHRCLPQLPGVRPGNSHPGKRLRDRRQHLFDNRRRRQLKQSQQTRYP